MYIDSWMTSCVCIITYYVCVRVHGWLWGGEITPEGSSVLGVVFCAAETET